MATFSRKVTVNWEGSIMEGKGTAKAGSGAFNLPISFPRRIGDAGIKITTSKLTVVAHGLEGIPKDQFAEVAKEAEGKCPVSNALRGSLTIELDAKAV